MKVSCASSLCRKVGLSPGRSSSIYNRNFSCSFPISYLIVWNVIIVLIQTKTFLFLHIKTTFSGATLIFDAVIKLMPSFLISAHLLTSCLKIPTRIFKKNIIETIKNEPLLKLFFYRDLVLRIIHINLLCDLDKKI